MVILWWCASTAVDKQILRYSWLKYARAEVSIGSTFEVRFALEY